MAGAPLRMALGRKGGGGSQATRLGLRSAWGLRQCRCTPRHSTHAPCTATAWCPGAPVPRQAPPGGFLASIQGYYQRRPQSPSSSGTGGNGSFSAVVGPSILQMWFVWAVPDSIPADTADSGLLLVAPIVMPVVPEPGCNQTRGVLPAGPPILSRAECGPFAQDKLACPSYACCGSARGRVGVCGTAASQCLVSNRQPPKGGEGEGRDGSQRQPSRGMCMCCHTSIPVRHAPSSGIASPAIAIARQTASTPPAPARSASQPASTLPSLAPPVRGTSRRRMHAVNASPLPAPPPSASASPWLRACCCS